MIITKEYIISLLFVWILLVVIQSFVHFYLIEVKHSKPFYLLWWIIRGIASILHGVAFDVLNMQEFWPILSFQLLSHFVVFGPLLNILRKPFVPKMHFWYTGEHSGWTDAIFNKLNLTLYKCIYFACAAGVPLTIWWIWRGYWPA